MYATIPDFSQAKILVVGDIMLDTYWHGNALRISPEAPVPIVHVQQQQALLGGAANVAANLASLGAEVILIGAIGCDEAGNIIKQQLQAQAIKHDLIQLTNIPTITKLRVISRQQQLIRLDFEQPIINLNLEHSLNLVRRHLQNVQVMILSDYAKGMLEQAQLFIQQAKAMQVAVLVDPKSNNFSKYRAASIITPNFAEFETIVGKCQDETEIINKGEQLCRQLDLAALLITRSEQGMTLLRTGQAAVHLPARALEVYDVTGAGDTVIAVMAASLAVEQDILAATSLANIAAGLVVGKLGTAQLTVDELQQAINPHASHGIHQLATLQQLVKNAQLRHKTVVMTNGCFDILHAGHVHYLRQAKQLGDYLIVAVNDDNSVRRLKGQTRPINKLKERLAVLSALECVDWLISFSEDTPQDLICALKPNILVKGGDYNPEDIAGGDCVRQAGGEVLVLDLVPGLSTTNILAKEKITASNID
jgi:D-beta-D-heptose 7-phosphate kinase / D-beta-D-heptose 1-phosphate adenosyltransferase